MISSRFGKKKSAMTLVEVMIATVVSFVLLSVLWRVFSGSLQQFYRTQRHLESMQVAQLIVEFVENDLQAMIVEDRDTETVLKNMEPRSSLKFHVSRGDQASGGIYFGQLVRYGLVPIDGTEYFYFQRNGRTLYNMPVKKLLFEPLEIPRLDSLPSRERKNFFIRTTVVALDSSLRGEYTLVALTGLELVSGRLSNGNWNETKIPCIRMQSDG